MAKPGKEWKPHYLLNGYSSHKRCQSVELIGLDSTIPWIISTWFRCGDEGGKHQRRLQYNIFVSFTEFVSLTFFFKINFNV